LLNHKDKNGKPYSPVYLRTIQNQMSAIFNHAVRYYNLRDNPCQKAGGMGKKKSREMLFWTKEEYQRFSEVMMDKPVSYYAFQMLYWCSIRRGELLAFLYADDWWEKDKLTKQLARMKDGQVVLCATGRELITPEGKGTGRVIGVSEHITYRMLLLHNCINCSSVLVRTDVAREFPMQHEDSHEDYIAWLGILKKYRWAAAINEPLLKYRLTSDGKSGNKLKSAEMTYRAYRYAGFSVIGAAILFCTYAVNGLWKYGRAYVQGTLNKRKRCKT